MFRFLPALACRGFALITDDELRRGKRMTAGFTIADLEVSMARRLTLAFLVISISVLGPVTLAYHAYANWVFRGRQRLDDGAPLGGSAPLSHSQPVEGDH